MTDQPYIKHPVVYGHPEDDDFQTSCPIHAQAYAKVRPSIPFMRRRLQESGRFKSNPHLEGQLSNDIELLVEWETSKLRGNEEWCMFGMGVKGKLDEPPSTLDGEATYNVNAVGVKINKRKEPIYDGMDDYEDAVE